MRRLLPAICLLFVAAACQGWHPQTAPAPEAVAAQGGRGLVRLTLHDQRVVELRDPVVTGDSIAGTVGYPPERVAVALREVRTVDTREVSTSRTIGLVAGVAGIAALAVAFAALVHAFSRFGEC